MLCTKLTNKPQINIREQQSRLRSEHERPNQRLVQPLRSLSRSCVDLALAPEVWVARQFPQARCASEQDGRLVRLGQEEGEEGEGEAGDPDELVYGPSPALGLGGETPNNWT